jgi:hypothetical protein
MSNGPRWNMKDQNSSVWVVHFFNVYPKMKFVKEVFSYFDDIKVCLCAHYRAWGAIYYPEKQDSPRSLANATQ